MQFWKNDVKCEELQKYLTCHNGKKKELLSIRTKLTYY